MPGAAFVVPHDGSGSQLVIVNGVVPYLLRHSAVSLPLDAGSPIEEVADLLGDNPQTVYRHCRHRVRPVVTKAAERMERLLGGEST